MASIAISSNYLAHDSVDATKVFTGGNVALEMDNTRRSALRITGGLLTTALGGCPMPSSETTPTDRSRVNADSLSFSGAILRQASDAAPSRIEATLSNDGQKAAEVGYGPALLFTVGEMVSAWPENILLDPNADVGPWDEPYQSDDGCWRFPEDGRTPVQSIIRWRTLEPNQSLRQEYYLYTRGASRPCLHAGKYRFQDAGYIGSEDQSIIFTLRLEIGTDQQLTAISGTLQQASA